MARIRLLVSAVGLAALPLLLSTCRVDSLLRSRTPSVEIALTTDTTASRGNVAVLDTVVFTPVVTIDNGSPTKPLPLRWFSSNPNVAAVELVTGKVIGVARGTSVITVQIAESALGALDAEASDTVQVIAASLGLAPADTTLLSVNDTLCYRPTVLDGAGGTIPDVAPALRVAVDPDSTVRVVGTTGCVAARSTGTPATIAASLDTSTVAAALTVRQRVDSIHIQDDRDTLFGVGETASYPATALDRRQNLAPFATIAWTTSNANVVSVDAAGQATAHGEGTAYVRAGADDGADSVQVTVAPSGPQQLTQLKSDGTTVLDAGTTNDETAVTLRGRLVDPDADATIVLEVEVRPLGTAFSNMPTATSPAVPRGQTATVTTTGLTEDTDYHWQARAHGASGRTSAWVSFGGNAETDRDFRVAIPEDPASGVGLGQFRSDGTTSIPVGASVPETRVVFKGTLSDPDPGDQLRLEVELKPLGTAFDGTGTVLSTAVGIGSEASVTIASIPDDANYHWRARAADQSGRRGAWASFGSNDEDQQDFNVPPQAEPPDVPTDPNQLQSDGTTTIAVGGVAFQSTVVLKGRITDADPGDQLTLQVEVRPVGTDFTNVATHTSTAVASGATASITAPGLSEDTPYHWQFRAADQTSRASPWTSFGANAENAADFRVALPEPPNTPTALGQFRGSNGAVINVGIAIDERTVVFKSTVTDPDPGDQIRLEVETKPLLTAFDGAGTTLGAAVSTGGTATVTIGPQTDDKSYHWRARAVDLSGRSSAWVSFETNLETEADYAIAVPEPPAAPASLGQFKTDDTPIATGGITDQTTVIFKATPTDPDAGALLRLEVERKLVGTGFDGDGTDTSAAVASGATASISKPAHTENAAYHWRARTLDETNRASAWVSFDVNAETAPDFRINATQEDPASPAGPGQFRSDGTTALAVNARTNETTVVFKATMADPDPVATIRLEVERKPIGAGFDGISTDTSAAVAAGAVATISRAGLDNTSYHWRARAIDETNRLSPWVSFGGNADLPLPAAVDYIIDTAPQAPSVPTGHGQFQADSITAILVGGNANQTTVVFKATVSDPDPGQLLRLQVEVRPVNTAFTPTPSATSTVAVASGSTAIVTVPALADNTNYHWQVRVIDENDLTSGWVSFGGNSDVVTADTDFTVPGVPEPPGAPTGLGQFKSDETTVIAIGDQTDQTTVVFKATVTDGDPGDMIKLEVEVKPVGTAFTGTGTTIGTTAVTTGNVAKVTVFGLTDNTIHHWRARAINDLAVDSVSAWVHFPEGAGNAEAAADFMVDATPQAPALSDSAQFKSDPTTPIALGTTTDQSTVILQARLTDPDPADSVRLEVEVKRVNVPFDSVGTVVSAKVASGTVASVTISPLADDTAYHWRLRAIDKSGTGSPWIGFGNNADPSDVDFRVRVPQPPAAPASLDQVKIDGSTQIGTGASTNEPTVIFKATLSADPDPSDQVRLDIEVRPIGQAFTGTPTHPGALGGGGTVQVTASSLNDDTNYHWRARSRDTVDSASAWVSFGANADGATDFSVAVPQDPNVPSELKQFRSGGADSMRVGVDTAFTNTVVLRARLTDPDPSAQARFHVEWQPVGTAFTNIPRDSSGLVPNGDTAIVTVTGLFDNTAYHWQVRAKDQTDSPSPWVSYGGNADPNDVDFRVWIPQNPNAPTGATQLKSNGSTTITTGGVTDETTVIFSAGVDDPDPGDRVRLEVEVRPAGEPFTDPTHQGNLVTLPGTATVTVSMLSENTGYHWQVRTVDEKGNKSLWQPFGMNGEDVADLSVNAVASDPTPPPSNPGQFESNGSTAIPVGGTVAGGGLDATVVFKATVFDPDPGDGLVIQVEARQVGTPLNGSPTHTGSVQKANGGIASLTATFARPLPLLGTIDYHWQVRTRDQTGRWSAWVQFGGNADGAADFKVPPI